MPVDTQHFYNGLSAFFEMATSEAERLLPPPLQPIEVRPQRAILAINAFHYRESEVGPYAELTFSVVVPPVTTSWSRAAKAGFYPVLSATSSEESRRHRERLRIPHYQADIDVHFVERAGELSVRAWGGGKPIVDLTVTQHLWESTTHLLQTFMMDGGQRFKADLQISGTYTVHEHEKGRVLLYEHPMTDVLDLDEIAAYPFREHWLKEGTEVFHPLETL